MGKRWWHDLCQECWLEANEGEYLPEEARDYSVCEGCGDDTIVYGHRGPFTIVEEPPLCGISEGVAP